MIALRYHKNGTVIRTEEPIPDPAPGEVLIRVSYCGICGTDLHIIDGASPAEDSVILGHEFSGTVVAAHDAPHLGPGTPVAVDPNNFCGSCNPCRMGNVHFCEHLFPTGISYDGGWAEYCSVPGKQIHPLPSDIPLEWGALAEPISCIVHGLDRLQPLSGTEDVLIMGSGLIGMLWALILRRYGFRKFLFSEPNGDRRHIASDLDFHVESPEQLESESNRFDVIIDCSGSSAALESAARLARPLGKILYFGICPEGKTIRLEPYQVFRKELTLLGSVINPFSFKRAIELIPGIQLPLERLGVSFFRLEDHESALSQARTGSVTKAIFRIQE